MLQALFAHHQEAMHIPTVVYALPPDDDQIVLETFRGCLILNKRKTKSASFWFHYSEAVNYFDSTAKDGTSKLRKDTPKNCLQRSHSR
jgi:hypothetical protein